jgi:hypothetical protein
MQFVMEILLIESAPLFTAVKAHKTYVHIHAFYWYVWSIIWLIKINRNTECDVFLSQSSVFVQQWMMEGGGVTWYGG